MERDKYMNFAFNDHLNDKQTYTRLNEQDTCNCLNQIDRDIEAFTKNPNFKLPAHEKTFITRSHEKVRNRNQTAFLYLTVKIHKSPTKTRPIISYCGSTCEGLAKWTDNEIKKITKHMPYVAKSSMDIVKKLKKLAPTRKDSLFTMDASAMYTNIHAGHTIPKIIVFLTNHKLGKKIAKKENIHAAALEFAIETVMKNNIFMFGDTYWLQKTGTAMGTPAAPDYATLYFAIWEIEIIQKYPELNQLYSRYIDDGFGIWTQLKAEEEDEQRWASFKADINSYGINHSFFAINKCYKPLNWEFSEISNNSIYLDLNISINENSIKTTIYEKKLNLHLYILPHSCHSPGITKSLIYGAVNRAKNLCTNQKDMIPYIVKTHDRLVARGHNPKDIQLMIKEALATSNNKQMNKTSSENKSLFLHLPYNPMDPSSTLIQRAFEDAILHPLNNEHIKNIHPVPFERLTIC